MRLGPLHGSLSVLLLACVGVGGAEAQSAYKYRDANGQWVFGDRAASTAPPAAAPVELKREGGSDPFGVTVAWVDASASAQLMATNRCLCVVTVRATVTESAFADIPKGSVYDATLTPGEQHALLQVMRSTGASGSLRYTWGAALGPPGAVHHPPRPYRAPFALGASFPVSQAYPARITHVTPDTIYAVDIVVPDGTPIYAAREGIVINVRHDSFRGAPVAAMIDQANVVEILHDDGTIAVYAHLHWDSIRVHTGPRVPLGAYLADSANTGFTTGPHLHFAVWRNEGTSDVSVPVEFAGLGGIPVTAHTGEVLTAY